jgi:alpha-glucosidase (family GH31 glycosyl hydrolase)
MSRSWWWAAAGVLLAGQLQAAQIEAAGTRLVAADGVIALFRGETELLRLDSIRFDYEAPLGWTVETAEAARIVLRLDYPAVVEFNHAIADNQPRSTQLEITAVDGGYRLHAAPAWAERTSLEFTHLGDHFFGLSEPLQPDNRHSPELSGAEIRVEVVNEGGNLAENYASAFSAFYISSHGYGAFFDTFAEGRYRFAVNGRNQVHHDTGTLDWYLFPGDDGAAIHRAYYALIGAPRQLPPWAMGPVAWRDHNESSAQILDDIKQFNELQMPLTAWFVDRPYSDGAHAWSKMNFSANFANPCDWIAQVRAQGLEFMTWTSSAFFGDTPLPRHLPGSYTYADLSDPATWAAYQQALAQQHACGVRGHKMDRADEHFPRDENWADASVRPGERRNRYAWLFARVHDEALRAAWGEDSFSFARAAIHRSQPQLGAIWGGDPRSNWEGLRGNLANAMRAGFMGFPVWGSDVGGYLGEGYIDPELYLRWMQFGVFSGFMEGRFFTSALPATRMKRQV